MCPEDIRQRFVDAAKAVVGLGDDPHDQDKQQQYMDLVAPGEVPARQQEMAKMSGCALVIAGIWRGAGVEHPILSSPYIDRTAVSRLSIIGKDAWVTYMPGRFPQPGDAVRVGDNTPQHGIEHMYIVTEIAGGNAPILHSIDGGQRDEEEHFQTIEEKQRAWMHGRDHVTGGTDPGAGSRAIMGWFDAVKLAALIPNLDKDAG